MLAGAIPEWQDSKRRDGEPYKRAKVVACLVRDMQAMLARRVRQHKAKAAPAVRWWQEREEHRGLMRAMLRAWAGVRGSANVPAAHLTHDEWRAWLAEEPAARQRQRRLQEAVQRIKSFAQTSFNKYTADRRRKQRLLRVRMAILRKARAHRNWNKTRAVVHKLIDKATDTRRASRWPKRLATLVQDAVQCLAREAAESRRVKRASSVVFTRRTRPNLLHAAVAGPALRALYPSAYG